MVQLKIAFVLLFITATLGVSSALKCYVCTSAQNGCPSDTYLQDINNSTIPEIGDMLVYCFKVTATVDGNEAVARSYMASPTEIELGCKEETVGGVTGRYCFCNTDGCNNDDDNNPTTSMPSTTPSDNNGAPTMMLGLFPALVSLIAYSFFQKYE